MCLDFSGRYSYFIFRKGCTLPMVLGNPALDLNVRQAPEYLSFFLKEIFIRVAPPCRITYFAKRFSRSILTFRPRGFGISVPVPDRETTRSVPRGKTRAPSRDIDTKTNRINFPLSAFQNRRQLTYEGSL